MLEREEERAAIAATLKRLGGCILVSGPAGIGKSALLEEARATATTPVLSARGRELERSFAFGGVQQLFARVPVPADGAAVHAAAAFATAGEPDGAVLHGLYWLTAGLGPLTIVVDDAHRLDRQTLRWLAYMANRVTDLPLALILAAQGDELLRRIAPHPSTRVLTPQPLSPAAVAELAGEERGAAIHEASGGNPFYVHALINHEADTIALRLEGLPAACTALARAMAVAGAGGTIAARVAGLDVRGAVEAAEALTAAGLLRGDDFAHPLVEQAVYAEIPAAQRADLHAAAARLVQGPERVAAQVLAAGPGRGVWAAQALRTAATAAWARGAPDVAASFLRRAAEEELPRDELVPLLRELARALIAVEDPGGVPAVREALALAPESEREATILELGRALVAQGSFSDAAAVLERGTSAAARTELAAVAVLDLSLVRRFGGLDALAARLPENGTSGVGAWIEVTRHPPAANGAGHAEAALQHPQPPSPAGALVALMAAGRLEQAEAGWTGIAGTARAAGALETLRLAVALRAIVRLRQGRVAEAEADLRELLAWGGELDLAFGELRMARPWVIAPLVDALTERGELDEAQHWVALTGLEHDWPEVLGCGFLLDGVARLRLAQGRVAAALALARETARRQRAWGIRNPGFLAWGSTLAAALAATGRTEEALDCCDEQADLARRFGVAREHGMALLTLGRITGEVETLRAAVDALAPSPARLEHARALVALGGALGEDEARGPLRQGLELAERCGATVLAAHARDLLVAGGDRPRRAPLTGAAALTAAQERVARLAAGGLGNRAIAERQFVTERTVEGHLAAAYRKLGIISRDQLETALQTEPRR